MLGAWLWSLSLTLAVELPVAWLVLRAPTRPTLRILSIALLGTLLTHPILWLLLPDLLPTYWSAVVVGESFAVAVETLVLLRLVPLPDLRSAFAAAACMNGASYLVGVLLR